MKKYNQSAHFYNKAIIKLKGDLEYLESNKKVSKKFVSMQTQLISSLEQYGEIANDFIENQSEQLTKQSLSFSDELVIKNNHILCLEALLIMHGVYDLDLWLKKGKQFLMNEAKYYYQNGFVHIPSKQYELLKEKNHPILNTLSVRQCKEIEELEIEIAEIKKKLKDARRRKGTRQETLNFGSV
jgi:hypothetical protein